MVKTGMGPERVGKLIAASALHSVFQPIAALSDGRIIAHEALVRGPEYSALAFPDALFQAAANEGISTELELACIATAIRCVKQYPLEGKVWLNLGASVLMQWISEGSFDKLLDLLQSSGLPLSRFVIELTEHERVTDVELLRRGFAPLRAQGIGLAIDDFGDGRSSLRIWTELQPEFVKIDKFFTGNLSNNPGKVLTLRAILQISEILGGRLIAEGIENGQDLAILRDLGISLGQGYFLGRPATTPMSEVLVDARLTLAQREVMVHSSPLGRPGVVFPAERLAVRVPAVSHDARNGEVVQMFYDNPNFGALAVVEGVRPIGLINRRVFMDRFTQPFHRELFGRRPCTVFMNRTPLLLDTSSSIEDILALLTSDDQRYLSDGFIVTDQGSYLGLGTGEQLVRMVTELRIEATRHANSLTYLPSHIPIYEHTRRLLRAGAPFTVCYCNLSHFKPFNDHYGYWRGDEMLRLLAGILVANVDSRRDFVGHIGADNFVVLFQSENWADKCAKFVALFNHRAHDLYDAGAIANEGIESENAEGQQIHFPLATLSIGAALINPHQISKPDQVVVLATEALRQAKLRRLSLWVAQEPLLSVAV